MTVAMLVKKDSKIEVGELNETGTASIKIANDKKLYTHSISEISIASGLIGYWDFKEGSGTSFYNKVSRSTYKGTVDLTWAAWSLKAFEVNTAGGGITITDGVVAVNRLIEKFTATAGQVDFVLANSPIADGEDVFVNGVLQDKGATEDYTIATNTVTFNIGLVVGDKVIVKYLK